MDGHQPGHQSIYPTPFWARQKTTTTYLMFPGNILPGLPPSVVIAGPQRQRREERGAISPQQRQLLERAYQQDRYFMNYSEDGKQLIAQLGLAPKQVRTWFNNRRAKDNRVNRRHKAKPTPMPVEPQDSPIRRQHNPVLTQTDVSPVAQVQLPDCSTVLNTPPTVSPSTQQWFNPLPDIFGFSENLLSSGGDNNNNNCGTEGFSWGFL